MINQILTAIDNVVQRKREFINSKTAYTRERDWPFDRNVNFQIFRERTTTRHDINTFYWNSTDHCYKRITRGNYSRQRQYINEDFYKEVNKEYLIQLRYNQELKIYKNYKGYRLFAVDGLTLAFDNDEGLRTKFGVKKSTL